MEGHGDVACKFNSKIKRKFFELSETFSRFVTLDAVASLQIVTWNGILPTLASTVLSKLVAVQLFDFLGLDTKIVERLAF